MRDYRLYLIDRITGHFKDRRDFSSDDDTSAIKMAGHCHETGAKELWRGIHMLRRWDAIPGEASAPPVVASTSPAA